MWKQLLVAIGLSGGLCCVVAAQDKGGGFEPPVYYENPGPFTAPECTITLHKDGTFTIDSCFISKDRLNDTQINVRQLLKDKVEIGDILMSDFWIGPK